MTSKSSAVRSVTSAPFLSVTVTPRFTKSTPERNAGACWDVALCALTTDTLRALITDALRAPTTKDTKDTKDNSQRCPGLSVLRVLRGEMCVLPGEGIHRTARHSTPCRPARLLEAGV